MSVTGFKLTRDLMEKIDTLRNKRGTNRSETLRFIVNEYFSTGSQRDIVDELERVKFQNSELKYQLEDLKNSLKNMHKEILSVLLIFAGQDQKTRERIKERFPHFWST